MGPRSSQVLRGTEWDSGDFTHYSTHVSIAYFWNPPFNISGPQWPWAQSLGSGTGPGGGLLYFVLIFYVFLESISILLKTR